MSSAIGKSSSMNWIYRISMLVLALYPVLFSYVFPFNLNYGETFLLILSFLCLFKSFQLPQGYLILWMYVAIDMIAISGGFKMTYLIPGGISFFIFSISVIALSCCFKLEVFYRYFRIIFILSAIVWCLQILNLLPPEYSRSFILPISDHIGYGEVDLQELRFIREDVDRASSFFLEPAYYAQFIAIYLAIVLFYDIGDKKLFPLRALFPIILLLALRSGVGIICLIVLICIKLLSYLKKTNNLLKLLYIIPIVVFVGVFLAQSSLGADMLSRTAEFSEEGSSGYLRVLQGYIIFSDLPLYGKLFGQEMVGDYMFANGLSTVLIRTGIIGMLLLIYVYIRMYIKGTSLSKTMIILLLSMSLVEQVYLGPSMLICTIIAFSSHKT